MLRCARLAALLAASSGGLAGAQDSPAEVARRDLVAQADAARRANQHAQALDLATRAAQIRMTPSLRLFIAQEHDSLGHLVEALDQAGRCFTEADLDAALRNRAEVLLGCRELRDSLAPRVARVVVAVPQPPPAGLVVRVGGTEVARPLWGVPFPVAPGRVTVEATAEGRSPFREELQVTPGASREVTLRLAPAPAGPRVTQRPPVPSTAPARERSFVERFGVAPLVIAGVGVAALGAAAGFFVARNGAVTDRNAACDRTGCDPAAQTHNSSAETFNTLTNVTLVAGLALVAGGVTWGVVSYTRPPPRAASLRWGVGFAATGATLTLGGTL